MLLSALMYKYSIDHTLLQFEFATEAGSYFIVPGSTPARGQRHSSLMPMNINGGRRPDSRSIITRQITEL